MLCADHLSRGQIGCACALVIIFGQAEVCVLECPLHAPLEQVAVWSPYLGGILQPAICLRHAPPFLAGPAGTDTFACMQQCVLWQHPLCIASCCDVTQTPILSLSCSRLLLLQQAALYAADKSSAFLTACLHDSGLMQSALRLKFTACDWPNPVGG